MGEAEGVVFFVGRGGEEDDVSSERVSEFDPHVAQPAVSLAIRELETELGADLFVRGRRGAAAQKDASGGQVAMRDPSGESERIEAATAKERLSHQGPRRKITC